MFEGDAAGARRVVEEEMPAAGVQPDDRTLEILHKPEHELGKMRAGELQRLIKAGDVAAAHVLMDKLKDNGTAARVALQHHAASVRGQHRDAARHRHGDAGGKGGAERRHVHHAGQSTDV